MRLLALAPWVAALIASAGATKPESVEEAGTDLFFCHDLFRLLVTCFLLWGLINLQKNRPV